MGRYLTIAQETKPGNTEPFMSAHPPPEKNSLTRLADATVAVLLSPMKSLKPVEPVFDAPASAVLQILVQADQPVPHQDIVQRMQATGHDKTTAKQAIARCQKRRWIEHNLTTGYVLS